MMVENWQVLSYGSVSDGIAGALAGVIPFPASKTITIL